MGQERKKPEYRIPGSLTVDSGGGHPRHSADFGKICFLVSLPTWGQAISLAEWFVAGLGTTTMIIAVFPTATTTMPITGTTISVFGWPGTIVQMSEA